MAKLWTVSRQRRAGSCFTRWRKDGGSWRYVYRVHSVGRSNIEQSVDLTRLPSLQRSEIEGSKPSATESTPVFEYSSREVSPAPLLLQQLSQAHHVFGLHNGPSLDELFIRLSKEKFCNTLERYWTRFARSWDVLLHGNPATDIFGGVKLASGGELGFGVGEEDWGSGEREVLEDLAKRTEGLIDLVVMRFDSTSSLAGAREMASHEESLPWMGSGREVAAADGIVFGGIAAISRRSLRDVSLWMHQIYTHGEQAYGVRENVSRHRRRHRARPFETHAPIDSEGQNGPRTPAPRPDASDSRELSAEPSVQKRSNAQSKAPQRPLPPQKNSLSAPSTALENDKVSGHTPQTANPDSVRPVVPAPIVSTAEEALQKATRQVDESDAREQTDNDGTDGTDETGTTLGIPDQYMKYLTFGLSTFGKPAAAKRPSGSRSTSAANVEVRQTKSNRSSLDRPLANGPARRMRKQKSPHAPASSTLRNVEPMPDGEVLNLIHARQKRQENRGHFVIGLTGDLQELDEISDNDVGNDTDQNDAKTSTGSRIVLRTVQVEVPLSADDKQDGSSSHRKGSTAYSASSNRNISHYRRVRVLVYVHRPFMYCFLFDDRTSSLTYTAFYKTLHRNLVAIHRPLLSSTDPSKVAQRIESSHGTLADDASTSITVTHKLPNKAVGSNAIFDLLYDPRRMTVHTSIPNIPEPGTLAAEGFHAGSKNNTSESTLTRVEALNIHSQILNTLASVKYKPNEIERTSKTSRGWWVVWLKLPPSAKTSTPQEQVPEPGHHSSSSTLVSEASTHMPSTLKQLGQNAEPDMHRIAFLVRKASDSSAPAQPASTGSRAVSSMLEALSLGMAGRDEDQTGGASAGWGPAALGSGIGIDARKYVESLLSLNR